MHTNTHTKANDYRNPEMQHVTQEPVDGLLCCNNFGISKAVTNVMVTVTNSRNFSRTTNCVVGESALTEYSAHSQNTFCTQLRIVILDDPGLGYHTIESSWDDGFFDQI